MTNGKCFCEPLLSSILSGVGVQPWLERQSMNLTDRKTASLFLRTAGIGMLANHFLVTEAPQGMDVVRERIAVWLELVPEHVLDEIELAAIDEAHRQMICPSRLDFPELSSLELMALAYERELLECVATLLFWRGRTTGIEAALTALDLLVSERLELRHTGVGWESDLLRSARKRGNRQEWWPKIAATD